MLRLIITCVTHNYYTGELLVLCEDAPPSFFLPHIDLDISKNITLINVVLEKIEELTGLPKDMLCPFLSNAYVEDGKVNIVFGQLIPSDIELADGYVLTNQITDKHKHVKYINEVVAKI